MHLVNDEWHYRNGEEDSEQNKKNDAESWPACRVSRRNNTPRDGGTVPNEPDDEWD
jgi:hypothetical protein